MRKKKCRDAEYYFRIDLSALLGIFFAIFITLATQNSISHGAAVDLVKSRNATPAPTALREDAMWISVTRDGKWYFGARRVSPEELPSRILEGLRNGAENRVFLLVDARAKYKDAEMVLEEIQRTKVRRVTFLTFRSFGASYNR
jgi:biopolymer transport protein ExbD